MRLACEDRRAYWAAGGDVLTSGGGLDLAAATHLEAFYRDAAAQARDAADSLGASYCQARATQLAQALNEASRWRRAGRSPTYQRRREPLSARYCSAAGVSTNCGSSSGSSKFSSAGSSS